MRLVNGVAFVILGVVCIKVGISHESPAYFLAVFVGTIFVCIGCTIFHLLDIIVDSINYAISPKIKRPPL